MRHYKNATLEISARIKIMQTVLKPVSHLSLLCAYAHLYSVDFCILQLNCTIALHTPNFGLLIFTINQVFPVNPKMMSDSILPSLTDLPPVIFILLPQSLRIQHMSTDTQLEGTCDPLIALDGFVSPRHHHAATQICH